MLIASDIGHSGTSADGNIPDGSDVWTGTGLLDGLFPCQTQQTNRTGPVQLRLAPALMVSKSSGVDHEEPAHEIILQSHPVRYLFRDKNKLFQLRSLSWLHWNPDAELHRITQVSPKPIPHPDLTHNTRTQHQDHRHPTPMTSRVRFLAEFRRLLGAHPLEMSSSHRPKSRSTEQLRLQIQPSGSCQRSRGDDRKGYVRHPQTVPGTPDCVPCMC